MKKITEPPASAEISTITDFIIIVVAILSSFGF
jgi:hypothetical protein